jgi:hypothetical protein
MPPVEPNLLPSAAGPQGRFPYSQHRLCPRLGQDTDISRYRRIQARYRSHREHLTPSRRPRPPMLPERSRWRGIGVHFERNRHHDAPGSKFLTRKP